MEKHFEKDDDDDDDVEEEMDDKKKIGSRSNHLLSLHYSKLKNLILKQLQLGMNIY